MASTAILFPGQGSLTERAAGDALRSCPELVEQACELLAGDPFERAWDSTRYAQPAVFLASLAGWRRQAIEPGRVCAMAGHSLGELSALVAAGALEPEDGLRLVVLRGELMADAVARTTPGGMVVLLGGEPGTAAELAARFGLTPANDNAPGELVISGPCAQLEQLAMAARAEGVKPLALDVAGAFHSPAIAPAEAPFRAVLKEVEWHEPTVPVVSAYSGRPFENFSRELSRALVNPVRWREVMIALAALGCREFVDVGPGRVLAKLAARNAGGAEAHALGP